MYSLFGLSLGLLLSVSESSLLSVKFRLIVFSFGSLDFFSRSASWRTWRLRFFLIWEEDFRWWFGGAMGEMLMSIIVISRKGKLDRRVGKVADKVIKALGQRDPMSKTIFFYFCLVSS